MKVRIRIAAPLASALSSNPKFEARNSKQIRSTNVKIRNNPMSRHMFRISDLVLVSDFDIRVSNFGTKPCAASLLLPGDHGYRLSNRRLAESLPDHLRVRGNALQDFHHPAVIDPERDGQLR